MVCYTLIHLHICVYFCMIVFLQVGTNLTDLPIGKKITIRELGGCMGPIWSSYYSDCHAVLVSIH